MSPPPKKSRICISISDKLQMIKDFELGVCTDVLSNRYSVSIRTVQRIIRQKDSYTQNSSMFLRKLSATRKRMYYPTYASIDEAVFIWFSQQISLGKPVSGVIVKEMANIFNEKLNVRPNFKASNGWLWAFQQRYGIRAITVQGEKLLANHEAANTFPGDFQKKIEGVHPSNLYNADEAGLFWRSFPSSTNVGPEEVGASGLKKNKDRVTFLFCANASGTHALPLLMIGKSRVPRCWKGVKDFTKLPVIYTNQKKAWMTSMIFLDWFGAVFKREVQDRQRSDGITGNVVLLLDNAGCHPPKEILDSVETGFFVEYLPPLCTTLLQPMDQGAIEITKRGYRRSLLRKLLVDEQDQDVATFQKALTLNDCAQLAARAWGEVHPFTLAKVWRKLLGNETDQTEDEAVPSPEPSILQQLRRVVPTILEAEVDEWLILDSEEPGHATMSVDDIVDSLRDVDADDEGEDNYGVASESGAQKIEFGAVEEEVIQHSTKSIAQEAITALKTAISCFERIGDSRVTKYQQQLEDMVRDCESLRLAPIV